MSSHSRRYRAELLKARRAGQRLAAGGVDVLLAAYVEMVEDLLRLAERSIPGSTMEQRALAMIESVRQHLGEYGEKYAEALVARTRLSRQATILAHRRGVEVAVQAAGADTALASAVVRDLYGQVPRKALEYLATRTELAGPNGFSAAYRTIARAGMQDAGRDIDRFIMRTVGEGMDHRQATRSLAAKLAEGNPELMKALDTMGSRGGMRRSKAREFAQLTDAQVAQARGLLRRSELVMVNEVSSANDEANKAAMATNPMVGAVRWNLSGRHGGLRSSPDECDVLAAQDAYQLGPGLYPPENVPVRPHPRCQCYSEPELRPPDEWDKDRPTPPPAKPMGTQQVRGLMQGRRSQYTKGKLTPARLRRVTRKVRDVTREAS